MAQFAVLIYAPDSIHSLDATPEQLKECDEDYETLTASGSLRVAYALTPREHAVTVTAAGASEGAGRSGADVVAGFYVLEAGSIEDAVRLARNNPAVVTGGAIEVRPVHSGGIVAAG